MRQSDGGPGSGPTATPVPGLRPTQLSEAILRAADNAGMGIVVSTFVDGKIRLAYVSAGAARIIGHRPEELLHKAADMFAAPEERERIRNAAGARNAGDSNEPIFETVVVHKDGHRVSVASATSPIEVDGVPGSVTFVWDTTELQTAKQAVRAGEAQFHAVIEAAPEGVVISREGIVLYANPTAERMLISEGDRSLVGRSLAEFMSPEDTMAMRDRIGRAMRGERFTPREYRAQRADGTVVIAEIVSLPFMHEGKPAVLAFARDVTERSRMQAQLAHADRLAALGTMAASVAHEINNPVTVMSFDLDLLGRLIESALPAGESRAAALGLLTDLRHSVGRVASIVRDLKAFSRPEEAASDAVEIGVAMESALRIASHAHGRDIEVVNQLGALPPVRANRGWLEQIFVNLLMNAFQALPDDRSGNRVVLRARRGGGGTARQRRGRDRGQRPRHPPRRPRPHLRSLLHHQARRRGDRARAVDLPRPRHRDGGADHRHQRARPGDDHARPVARPRAGRSNGGRARRHRPRRRTTGRGC